MPSIAGHTFDEKGVCDCGIRRIALSGVTRAHIGTEGWAHSGLLNEAEYRQILEDQPPPVMRGASTRTGGTDRLYHDCDMSTELVTSTDTIQVERKTWYIVRCSKCDERGRLSSSWPVVQA